MRRKCDGDLRRVSASSNMPRDFPVNFLRVISSEEPAINYSIQAVLLMEMWDAIDQSRPRSCLVPSREFDLADHHSVGTFASLIPATNLGIRSSKTDIIWSLIISDPCQGRHGKPSCWPEFDATLFPPMRKLVTVRTELVQSGARLVRQKLRNEFRLHDGYQVLGDRETQTSAAVFCKMFFDGLPDR
jgi:hypothetical protein